MVTVLNIKFSVMNWLSCIFFSKMADMLFLNKIKFLRDTVNVRRNKRGVISLTFLSVASSILNRCRFSFYFLFEMSLDPELTILFFL